MVTLISALPLLVMAQAPNKLLAQNPTLTPVITKSFTLTPAPIPTTTPTINPTPAIPAVIVIQATPIPPLPLTGNIFEQVWETKKAEIIFSVITLILIGVFLRQIAEGIGRGGAAFLNWITRMFADWIVFRRRLFQDYVSVLDEEIRKWQFARSRPLDMEQFYIRVQVTQMPAHLAQQRESSTEWFDLWAKRRRENKLEPRQALSQYERIAVIGEPGMGKTTLLRYLAYLYSHDKADDAILNEQNRSSSLFSRFRRNKIKSDLNDSSYIRLDARNQKRSRRHNTNYQGWKIGHRVPVYIPLKDLSDVNDIVGFLVTYFEQHNYPNATMFVKSKLDKGEFIFLLDALDEIDDPERLPFVVELVARFANRYSNQQHPNWIVVTSRPQSYQQSVYTLNFQVVELLEFEPQQIKDFITNWFSRESKRGDRLWEIISSDNSLMELGTNPLMLTLIVEAFDLRNELAINRRAELYSQIVNVRFWEWDSVRKVQRDFKFTQPIKENFLKQLALELNVNNKSLIHYDELLAAVRGFLTADGKVNPDEMDDRYDTLARRFIWEIAEGSGILYQKAISAYDFSHKTLREYFSAWRLCEHPDGLRLLLGFLQSPGYDRWEMVVLLYAGKIIDATPLIRSILQLDRTLSKRGLLLVARCLNEASNIRERAKFTDEIADAIFLSLPSVVGDVRKEGIFFLRSLETPKIEMYINRLLDSSPDANKLNLISELLPSNPSEDLKRKMSTQLLEPLNATDEIAKSQAASLLAQASVSEAAIPLLSALEASEPVARLQSAKGLARLGNPEPMILNALRRAMNLDGDSSVRFAARDALLLLGCAKELNMIEIPAGKFLMGTSDEQCGYLLKHYGWDATWAQSETPQRLVDLPQYFIDKTLVTNAAFAVFVAATGYKTTAETKGSGWMKVAQRPEVVELRDVDWAHPRGPGSTWEEIPDHPVVLLSWYDVNSYAQWVGKRLPTEAEWEKSARGTDGRLWPWGNEWNDEMCNTASYHAGMSLLNLNEWGSWWQSFDQIKYGPTTTPVGSFTLGASPYGLLDCAGNVCERTSDWYKPYPGSRYETENFGEKLHVLRGGAWHHHANLARVSARDFAHPLFCTVHDGFRCCLTVSLD